MAIKESPQKGIFCWFRYLEYNFAVRNKLILISALLIVLEIILHFWGVFGFGYINFWWLDVLTHTLGGFWLSLTAIWFVWFSGYLKIKSTISFLKIVISGIFSVFVVAILWEFFEFLVGLDYSPEGYWIDTIIDIICGTCGGVISSLVSAYLWKKNSN